MQRTFNTFNKDLVLPSMQLNIELELFSFVFQIGSSVLGWKSFDGGSSRNRTVILSHITGPL